MTHWNPAQVFETHPDLRLTPTQVADIQRNMPQAADDKYYTDAVFEGGGVKGTAFLGALRCFADAEIQFRKVAGTSAGAITAAMVAAGFTIDQLEAEVIGPLDYEGELLSKKTSWLINNGSPSDDLNNFQWLLARLVVARQEGQYESEPFKHWLSQHLHAQQIKTFGELTGASATGEWYEQRDLRVVISDLSNRQMRVLPDDANYYQNADGQPLEADTFEVAEAVRLSMSIPLFFTPGELGGATIVDGGLLSNFPLWIYDAEPGQVPKCPTFGFRLMEAEVASPSRVEGAFGILRAMMETMQVAWDSHHTRENDLGRVIDIPTGEISATKFDLTTADKDALYLAGYQATKDFLLEQWSWTAHLRQRGITAS